MNTTKGAMTKPPKKKKTKPSARGKGDLKGDLRQDERKRSLCERGKRESLRKQQKGEEKNRSFRSRVKVREVRRRKW